MNNVAHTIAKLKPTCAGQFLYYFLPYRKKIILRNMHHVFGQQLNSAQIIHLAKCFYSHVATSLKENFILRFLDEKTVNQKVQIIGHEILLKIAEQNKGLLILTGHFGNWEFAPIAGIANFKQAQGKFYFIRKTLRFKFLERLLFRRFYRAGLHVIPKKNSLNQVCEALDGNNAVVFVLDQHASLHNKDGIMVEFFGKKAGTYRSLATIARYTSAPVIPAASYRKPDGNHVLEFYEPIPYLSSDNSKEELYLNTLSYNQSLERLILAHPEQWLWMHKRWK